MTEQHLTATTECAPPECDGVKWLALVLRDAFLMVVTAIEVRYGVHRKHKCSKCGWRE